MKKQLEKVFEMFVKLNPDFKVLNEADIVQQNPDFQFKTYGDLKKIINVIKLQQKGKKIGGIAFDQILGAIPGIGTAKTAYDVYKAAFSKPDTKKTNTWLDKLDIDDDTSAIVDDTVENGFLTAMSNMFNSEPDDKLLEPDFNMNSKLSEYLSGKYNSRTVTGFET